MRSGDLEVLRELNQGYVRSVAGSDAAWFERHLAPDFVNSNPDGSLVDCAQFLEQVARPIALAGLRAQDVRIRILGDVAIVHGRTVYRKPDGAAGAGRYTDVWQRAGATWRCVAAHVTRG